MFKCDKDKFELTMVVPENLMSLYSARIKDNNGVYYIPVPADEVDNGVLDQSKQYRVGLIETDTQSVGSHSTPSQSGNRPNNSGRGKQNTKYDSSGGVSTGRGRSSQQQRNATSPPVSEGDQLEVKITSYGEEGDGVARTEEGYVIFVDADVELGEDVMVQMKNVNKNYGFADVVE